MSTLIVVGAGPSGLGTALALASGTEHQVHLVDRIPVVGGESGWDTPEIRVLARDVDRAGVKLRLGATATRWKDDRLLLTGPGQVEWVPGRQLFFAGGRRPSTAADLRLAGERPAGVLPATVAEHLLTSGVALWRRPLIIGEGPWAHRLAHHIRGYGGYVLGLQGSSAWANESFDRHGAIDVLGRERVVGVRLHDDGTALDIECDAIILAAGPYPNRNIDGALAEGARNVTFVQPLSGETIRERFDTATAIATEWIRSTGGIT